MKPTEPKYNKNSRAFSVILFFLMFTMVGCPDNGEDPILLPDVKFSVDRTLALEGDTIRFDDRSLNEPSSWRWSFGDGNTSTEQEPEHVYNSGGTYTVQLEATNESGTNALEKPDYITIIETGTLTDDRDGNTYKTVEIGEQVWMAENLKYLPSVTTIPDHSFTNPIYYVFDYMGTDINAAIATNNYLIYGVLYNWPALMNGEHSSGNNPSGVQGVCPTGWHVPSTSEWDELITHLGGTDVGGGKLKEEGFLHWETPNTGATNETGFTALAGGGVWAYSEEPKENFEEPEFEFLGYYGVFWTASEVNEKIAWYYYLSANDEVIQLADLANSKGDGFSVRCVQD